MKLKRECGDEKSENSCEENDKRRTSNLTKSKSLIKLIENKGKTRGVKKVNLCHDDNREKLNKEPTFYTKRDPTISLFLITNG